MSTAEKLIYRYLVGSFDINSIRINTEYHIAVAATLISDSPTEAN